MFEATARANEAFYSIAQGQAILAGRNWCNVEDAIIPTRVCIDSCSVDRRKIFLELNKKGKSSVKSVQDLLKPKDLAKLNKKRQQKIQDIVSHKIEDMQIIGMINVEKNIVTFSSAMAELVRPLKNQITSATEF